jgi:MOSC domain-containing protein YiiM
MAATVISVARDDTHRFSKRCVPRIQLVAGIGVEGDAHAGRTVKHRSRVKADPTQPNLRQVHLIHAELLEELAKAGFEVGPGDLGENVTTRGIDLLALSRGTRLHIGATAIVEVTGLRNPCRQIDDFRGGLLPAVLERRPDGTVLRKTGVMAIVLEGGRVAAGDPVAIHPPAGPAEPLQPV